MMVAKVWESSSDSSSSDDDGRCDDDGTKLRPPTTHWTKRPWQLARAVAAGLSGHFPPRSLPTTAARWLLRTMILACPILSVVIEWDVMMGGGRAGLIALNITLLLAGTTFAIFTIVPRAQAPAHVELFRETMLDDGPHSSTEPRRSAGGCGSLLAGILALCVVMLLAVQPLERAWFHRADPVRSAWWLCGLPWFVATFDVVFVIADWVGASHRAIRRFGAKVAWSVGANPRFYDLAAGSVGFGRATADLNGPKATKHQGRTAPLPPQTPLGPVPATFSADVFDESFGRAQAVVGVMNTILAGPITVFLGSLFVFVVLDWVLIVTSPSGQVSGVIGVVTTAVFTAFLPGALVWLSSVGDVYSRVRDLLLAPNIVMKIVRSNSIDRPSAEQERLHVVALTASLERTKLAFSVFQVGMTSQNVIYLIGSVSITAAISLAPQLANG